MMGKAIVEELLFGQAIDKDGCVGTEGADMAFLRLAAFPAVVRLRAHPPSACVGCLWQKIHEICS